jgi:L-iditol 2-dehydrogenase
VNRVARLYRWGDVRIEDAPMPQPEAGEIVVKVEACGLCGSDALTWYVDRKAPVVLGHEPVGSVSAVGTDAPFQIGERVFVHHHVPCMECEQCRRKLWSNCALWKQNTLDPGGFARYVRVRAHAVARDTLRIPATMSDETATFIEPLACCIRAAQRHGHIQPGDTVLVVGLGAMGLLLAQLARLYGAQVILGSDFMGDRREQALLHGVQFAFDPRADAQVAQARALMQERGADVVIVCPGDERATASGIEFAAPGARVVCFTPLPPDQPVALDLHTMYFKEISLHQSYSCGPDETRAALELLQQGYISVDALITHREGLHGVAAALERAHGKGEGLKSVILPWKE